MNAKILIFFTVLLFLSPAFIRAAEPEAGSSEKVYRDYTEAYQKAAASYEKAAKENQSSSYVTYAVVGAFLVFIVIIAIKNRRAQKAYTERALELRLANQKLLEEIRDLLKNGRK